MANDPGIKIKFVKSPLLLKVAVLVLLVLCMVTLLVQRGMIRSAEERTEKLRLEAMELEQDNEYLQQCVSQLGTVKGIIQIAQQELGLVEPGTVIIDTQTTRVEQPQSE